MRNLIKSLGKILKSWWFLWLIIGIILRLLIAPFAVHSDVWSLNFTGYLFAFKGVTNIYDYLANLSPLHEWSKLYGSSVFAYPPLAYFLLGTFMFILKPLFNFSFMEWFVNHSLGESIASSGIFRHLLLLKLPYLFFDIGIALLLMKLFDQKIKQRRALILWVFNPLSLYTSFLVGQFDVIPLFFLILSLYLVLLRKNSWALIALGIGGSLKLFPLFFLPVFVLVLGKNILEKIKLTFLGILPYLLTIFPFLPSPAFRQTVLFSNQSQKMLFMSLPVSGAEVIYIFVTFLVAYWFWLGYGKGESGHLWKYLLIIFLLFFSVTHYHPQWFLWITPFIILELVENNFKNKWLHLILFVSWFLILLFFEKSLSFGLFRPLIPDLDKARSLSEIVLPYLDVNFIKSLIRSVFAAASIILTIRLLRIKFNE